MLKGAITAIVTPFKNGQLDEAAYRELIEFQIQGGIHGIVPCGTTGESPPLSHAQNKPTQEGLYQHYKAVASQTKIPIVVYNVPGRTSLNLLPETVARLAEFPNIVGLKDATGDLKQGCKTLELCGDKITVLSGDDFTTFPLLCVGGMGVISVVSNAAPGDMAGMGNAFFAGDLAKARAF